MIQEFYILNSRVASNAESTARNQIEHIKRRQADVLHEFEKKPKKQNVIAPAFQWAQSLENVFISVKFAYRIDGPGCLDIFDETVEITSKSINMTAFCRIDKQVNKYELYLPLFGEVDIDNSTFEIASVGRLYINLDKIKTERWRRLLSTTDKLPNMSLWWDQHEKYEDDLLKHTQFETDESMENFIHIDNSPPPKKKEKKKKKKELNFGTIEIEED